MRARAIVLRTLFFLGFLSMAAAIAAPIVIPSYDALVRQADLVVVARPVEMRRVPLAGQREYELDAFAIDRVLIGNLYSNELHHPRICVFRQVQGGYVQWRYQELTVGTPYLLVLKKATPDDSYTFIDNDDPIKEATDATLRKFFQEAMGSEGEPLDPTPMPIANAKAHAIEIWKKVAAEAVAAASDEPRFAKLDAYWVFGAHSTTGFYSEGRCAGPIPGLVEDRRLIAALATWPAPDAKSLSWSRVCAAAMAQGTAPGFVGVARSVSVTASDERPRISRTPVRVGQTLFADSLVAEETIETARGPCTVRVILKVGSGAYGDVLEARRVASGVSFDPPEGCSSVDHPFELIHGWSFEREHPIFVCDGPADWTAALERLRADPRGIVQDIVTRWYVVSMTDPIEISEPVTRNGLMQVRGMISGMAHDRPTRFAIVAIQAKRPLYVVGELPEKPDPAADAAFQAFLDAARPLE